MEPAAPRGHPERRGSSRTLARPCEEATFLLSGLKTPAGLQADAVRGLCLAVYQKQGQRWFASAVQCMVPPPPPGR